MEMQICRHRYSETENNTRTFKYLERKKYALSFAKSGTVTVEIDVKLTAENLSLELI